MIKNVRNFEISKCIIIHEASSIVYRSNFCARNISTRTLRVLLLSEISEWNNGASRTGFQKFTEFDYGIAFLCRYTRTRFYAGVSSQVFSHFPHFVDGIYVTYTNSGYFGIIALQFSFRLSRICRFSSTMKIKRNVKSEKI